MNNRINKIWLPLVFFAVATAFISCSHKKENEKRPKADLQAKTLEALEESQENAVSAESNSGQISTVLSKEPEQDFKLAEDGHKQIFLIQLDDLQQKEEILWDIAQQEKLHDPGYGLRFFRSDIADADYKIRLSMDSYMAAEGYFSIGDKHVRTTFDATAQGELFYTYIDTLPSAKYLGKQD